MLNSLFSYRVLVEHTTDAQPTGSLYPEERESLRSPSESRLREFTVGRLCARKALARLGVCDFPVLIGKDREPVWPRGVTGSISHCGDRCIVAVSNDNHVVSIGIDVERALALDEDVADMVCTANERRSLAAQIPPGYSFAETLIFSAKESVYKCLFPIARTFLEFSDVEIVLSGDKNEFGVKLLRPEIRRLTEPFHLRGRYYCGDSIIYTAMELAKTDSRSGQ